LSILKVPINYVAAKTVIAGLRNWLTELEVLLDKAATEYEAEKIKDKAK
jgi:hypothetical protein